MKQTPKGPVVINHIPRVGEWTGSNQLGNEVAFAPDANNQQRVLHMPEWGPPEVWTITLGQRVQNLDVSDSYNVTGIIQFGVGGSVQTVKVDWMNGTQLSVVANSIDVVAFYADPPTFAAAPAVATAPKLSLNAQVARGSRSGPFAPQYSLGAYQINPNAPLTPNTVMIPIPAYAKNLVVMPTSASTQDRLKLNSITYTLVADNGTGGLYDVTYGGDYFVNATSIVIPCTARARFLRVLTPPFTGKFAEFYVVAELYL